MGSDVASSWKRLKVAGKMRRQERETMGRDVISDADFIGIVGNNMMIHFPRKKVPLHFNNSRNPDAESRSQKVGSLKDFEIRGVPEKELPHTGQKVINPFGMVICLK
jgi:hypothetical protein